MRTSWSNLALLLCFFARVAAHDGLVQENNVTGFANSNTISSSHCDRSTISRRRQGGSCSCRRRHASRGQGDLPSGWVCKGQKIVKEETTETTATRTQESTPPEVENGHINLRFMAYNVFYGGIHRRASGVARTVANLNPDFAVFTELFSTKYTIAKQANALMGSKRRYIFCDDGPQQKYWDGDIMYDALTWTRKEDGVEKMKHGRGLSWARFRHKRTNQELLVYGIHPLRPGHHRQHLENAMFLNDHLGKWAAWPRTPVVIMGDFNAMKSWPSMRCYAGETTHAGGVRCKLRTSFTDTFYAGNSRRRSNTHRHGGHIDHILVENREPQAFYTKESAVYTNAPGRSDHYPIWADVKLVTGSR